MDEYYISAGMDRRLHIYKHQGGVYEGTYQVRTSNCQQEYDFSWEGLLVTVRQREFSDFIFKPHEIGDEFEVSGRTFVVIDLDYRNDFICTLADSVGYRLLLHRLIWWTELRLEYQMSWATIPRKIRDVIDTPEMWKDIKEYQDLFREKCNARNSNWLATRQTTS